MKYNRLAITISLILGSQTVSANPAGAQVVQGAASFSNPSANVLNINNSHNAIINWQSFNIGAGQTTNFIQPSAASSVLNRVISNNPSQILGNLNSNGRVFLINQHGLLVGEGASINTAGFFGSTLNITDADFLNGNLKFAGGGQGDLHNQGYIHAGDDGSIVLIAPNIENGGVIEVENGNIILAAGKSITITSLENPAIQFEVTSAENKLTNLGQVIAKNGAAHLFAGTLRHSGAIRASGLVQNADGSISLVASDHVEVSGSVDVSGEHGGHIEILGDVVDIQDGANVNASGVVGGGEILIGGDQQGLNPAVNNATSTTIAQNAQVHADALDSGNGGKVIVFAQNDVHVHGAVTATGGANGGDGGFIETSGLKQLDITRIPDASAAHGQGGDWLIDPNNITIQATGPDTNITPVEVTGLSTYDTNDDAAILTTATIVSALELGNNVIVTTTSLGADSEAGNITVNDPIVATTPLFSLLTLTLNADNDININSDITGVGWGFNLTLNAGNNINLSNAMIDTGGSTLSTMTFNALQMFVAGNVAFGGVNSAANTDVIINTPLEISGNLNIGNSESSVWSMSGSAITITPTGKLDVNIFSCSGGDCNDFGIDFYNPINNGGSFVVTDADFVNIWNDFDNTGGGVSLDYVYYNMYVDGLMTLDGSSVTGFAGVTLTIGSNGILDVISPTAFDPGLVLELQEGLISNAQNLTIPDTFNWFGGTVSGDGVFQTPAGSTTSMTGGTVGQTLQGLNAGSPLDWVNSGSIQWNGFGVNNDITLTDAKIINRNQFYISLSSPAQISGNGKIFNDVGAFFGIGTSNVASINTTFENAGVLSVSTGSDVLNLAGDLKLEHGALLMGEGQLNLNGGLGTLTVNNGGGISPGNNDDGTLTIAGNLVVNPGANLIFDLESNVLSDKINVSTGNVTLNGGELFVLWEGVPGSTGFSTIANSSVFSFIECFTGPCMTPAGATALNIHDPLNVTGSAASVVTGSFDMLQFTLGTKSGTVVEWTGATNNVWSEPTNWFLGAAPGPADNVIIDDSNGTNVSVDITSSVVIAGLQTDASLIIGSGGSLDLSGDGVMTLTYGQTSGYSGIDINGANAALSGSGRLFTLAGSYNHFHEGSNVTISEWNNDGLLSLENTPTLIFDGTAFTNHGSFRFMQTDSATVQLTGGGIFNNNGLIVSNPKASDVALALSSNGPDGKIRIEQGTLFLGQNVSSSGGFDIAGTLALTAGTTLNMLDGSSFSGTGSIDLTNALLNIAADTGAGGVAVDPALAMNFAAGSTLNQAQNLATPDAVSFTDSNIIALSTPFRIPSTATVTLSGFNTLSGDMEVNGLLDWNDGVLSNSGTASLTTTPGSTTLLGSAGSTTLSGVSWLSEGAVDWVSADDFVITGTSFTQQAGAGFTVNTTGANADISGTGSFVNKGSFSVPSSTTSTDLNIMVNFSNLNDGSTALGVVDLDRAGYNLSFEGSSTMEGPLNALNGVISFPSGTHNFANGLALDGDFSFTGSTITGSGGTFTTSASSNSACNGCSFDTVTWQNDGVIEWVGSDFNINSGALLINNGSLNGNATGVADDIQGAGLFRNMGTYTNNNAGETTDISATFENSGTVTVAAGSTLQMTSANPFVVNNGTMNGAGNFITAPAVVTVCAGCTLGSSLTWQNDGTIDWVGFDFNIEAGANLLNNGVLNGNATGIADDIQGAGSFQNAGVYNNNNAAGTTNISSAFINSGIINIQQGTFLSLAGSDLTLGGGSLTGSGTFNGNVIADNGSTVAAGASPGSLSITGDMTFQSGSTLAIELESVAAGFYDELLVSGNVSINTGATLAQSGFNGYTGNIGDNFPVIVAAGSLTGSFDTLIQDAAFNVTPLYTAGPAGGLLLTVSGLNNYWILNGSGSWVTPGNWSRGVVPGVDHEVIIDNGAFTVSYNAGTSSSIKSLTTINSATLEMFNGSDLSIDGNVSAGILNLDGASLVVNGDLTGASLTAINDSIVNGSGNLAMSSILTLLDSELSGWSGITAQQMIAQGNSRFTNTYVSHDGQLEITTAADQLALSNTQMISSSSASITGAGSLDLQTGSDWTISTAGFLMPEAMTLDLNGGNLRNVENLVFPGTVNVFQANFTENGSIVIPVTTTFNYLASEDISPGYDVTNNGAFIIQSAAADLNLSAQNNALFINNGTFDITSATTLHAQTDLLNNGALGISAAAAVIVEPTAVLTIDGGGSIKGDGVLTVKGGVMDVAVATVLADTLVTNLETGSITNAQNLSIPGSFNWVDGTLYGTGNGFTTSGQVNLLSGTLNNADWLVAPAGVVDWTGPGDLIINNATITNQGEFRVTSSIIALGVLNNNLAFKDFTLSQSAAFINQGLLLIDAGTDTIVFDLSFDNDGGTIGIVSGIFSLGGAYLELMAGESLQGFGTFSGNVINTAGLVSPGKSDLLNNDFQTGLLTIDGNYTQGSNGRLVIKLDSTLSGLQHDVLDVTGLFTAGGVIDFKIINNKSIVEIAALLGDSFRPLKFGSYAGRFSQANIPVGLNFTLGENGVISISSDNPLLNTIANQLEVLFTRDDLDYSQMVQAMRFVNQDIVLAQNELEEDEEKRAPRLVCK